MGISANIWRRLCMWQSVHKYLPTATRHIGGCCTKAKSCNCQYYRDGDGGCWCIRNTELKTREYACPHFGSPDRWLCSTVSVFQPRLSMVFLNNDDVLNENASCLLQTIKRCSTTHSIVQRHAALFNDTQHCSTTRSTVQRHTTLLNDTQHCSTTHSIVQRHTALFNKTQHCSTKHSTVQRHTALFNNTQHCSTTHSTVQRHTALFNDTQHCSTTQALFNDTQHCSTTHITVQRHTALFNDTQHCSTTHSIVLQHTELFNNTQLTRCCYHHHHHPYYYEPRYLNQQNGWLRAQQPRFDSRKGRGFFSSPTLWSNLLSKSTETIPAG
jgi:hypothetical protein